MERVCILRMVDCALRRIAALACLGRIADCTLGTLRCKDARPLLFCLRPLFIAPPPRTCSVDPNFKARPAPRVHL
eukprot:15069-Alexandrium_andersonii.AAC.1